jgi:hypothetical protein
MNLGELRNTAMSFDTAVLEDVRVGSRTEPEKKFRAVTNQNTGKTVAMVSDGYFLAQHSEVVGSVTDALMNLNIKADASVRNDGNRVFVDIEFPESKLYASVGEEFFCGIRVINSYNKTTGIMVLPRLVRLACANGMVVNVGWVHEFNIKHTQKLAEDFSKTVQIMIKEMVGSNEKFKAMMNNCIGDSVEWELLDKIMSKLVDGRNKHLEAIKKLLVEKYAKDKTAPTRWDVYNAFTDYATHGEQIKPSIEQWIQSRAQKLLIMPLAELVPKSN